MKDRFRRIRTSWRPGTRTALIALAVAGCLSPARHDVTWNANDGPFGCSFWGATGTLIDLDGRTALVNWNIYRAGHVEPLVVRWPEGWQVRYSVLGELEVLNPKGRVQARAGARVLVATAADNGNPTIVDGELLACPSVAILEQGSWFERRGVRLIAFGAAALATVVLTAALIAWGARGTTSRSRSGRRDQA